MDPSISSGLVYGIIAVVVAGGLLFMTRKTSLVTPLVGIRGYVPNLSTFQRWGRIAGILIPFVIIAVGPLMDLYYNGFHYTTISLVGISAMVLGFLYQSLIQKTSAYLSTLTIGTAATLTYILFDLWSQAEGYNFKVISTVVGVVLMFLQLLHTVSGPVFSSSALNDGVGMLLGSGLGAIAWTIVYNTYREYLPFAYVAKPAKK
jgi:hypothetical protein